MPTADPVALLIDHLRCRQAHGEKTVLLTRPARQALAAIRSGARAAPAPAPDPAPPRAKPTPAEAAPAPVSLDPARSDVLAEPAAISARATPPAADPTTTSPADQLAALRAKAEHCPRCKALGTLRDTFVFAAGNPEADLMFVGEAPGYDEERLGEPFVGKAGQLLDKIISAMGLERGDTYISNIVKWRPSTAGDGDQGTANRKPTAEEMEAAKPYVLEEIAIVRPRVIVALGGTAATGLLGREEPVGSLRSKFHDLGGTPLMATYHPSYLLRSGSNAEKRKVWEDLLMVMEKLDMPVTAKQRGFFLAKGR